MVLPTDDHRVYAYVTNTRARLLLVYDDVADPGEATVREAFAKLHDAYADAMSDPFAAPGRPIENARFEARVARSPRRPSPRRSPRLRPPVDH